MSLKWTQTFLKAQLAGVGGRASTPEDPSGSFEIAIVGKVKGSPELTQNAPIPYPPPFLYTGFINDMRNGSSLVFLTLAEHQRDERNHGSSQAGGPAPRQAHFCLIPGEVLASGSPKCSGPALKGPAKWI